MVNIERITEFYGIENYKLNDELLIENEIK